VQLLLRFASLRQTKNHLLKDPTTRGSKPLSQIRDRWASVLPTRGRKRPLENTGVQLWTWLRSKLTITRITRLMLSCNLSRLCIPVRATNVNFKNKYAAPPCSRTKIYATRMSRGSSSYRAIFAAGLRPTSAANPPHAVVVMLLSIDGMDERTDTDGRYANRIITCMYRVGQKSGPQTHDHNSVKS